MKNWKNFERACAKLFSKAFFGYTCEGGRADVDFPLVRNVGSGNQKTSSWEGDLIPNAAWITRGKLGIGFAPVIELKAVKNAWRADLLLKKKGEILKFWDQCCSQAQRVNGIPVLGVKDRGEVWILVDDRGVKLGLPGSFFIVNFPEFRLHFYLLQHYINDVIPPYKESLKIQ